MYENTFNGPLLPGKIREARKMSLGPLNTGEDSWIDYAEKDVPQPQPPVALGFSNVKPDPIIFVV